MFALSLLGVLALAAVRVERELAEQRNLHHASYVTAAECTRCHPQHAESFARTFHRTMTRSATRADVKAPFAGETLDYFGVRARMERDERGKFWISYGGESVPEQRYFLEKTVGSRRYQQYVARAEDGSQVRLPLAYHLEEQRWFHMNGAFLTPDPEPSREGQVSRADYERHVTRWNDNCVFCHNVAPNPGKHEAHGKASFDTEVAELGIACEACHGPASEHAALNANPLRRYRLHASEAADPTIVNPARLPPERSSDLCGRCHGQRLTDDVEQVLAHGDAFVPGEDLALYSAPLWRDSTLNGQGGLFEARFWPDGTPRLTAYEYQGMLMSACNAGGKLTCISCHGMHTGDPRGQIRPERVGAAMCTGCHHELEAPRAQREHAHHPEGVEVACTSCHMPDLVYGVLAAHPSHRIERPDPARAAQEGRPDACTECHVNRTRVWAARARARLWRPTAAEAPSETVWSELETRLFAGDPLERALAAHAFAKGSLFGPRQRAMLLEVMVHDSYPAVRHFAVRTLRLREPGLQRVLAGFVPEWTKEQRSAWFARTQGELAPVALDREMLTHLRAQAEAQAIDIGE
jgi:predicted CXXCH cytochrome family protein